jgi:riboflavin synthase
LFTGIIEGVGTVSRIRRSSAGDVIAVTAPGVAAGVGEGDSVAVNGVCQTVERTEKGILQFTAVAETLRRTTLGALRPGSKVNLERALGAGAPLGGHIVQGHVDGVGEVTSLVRRAGDAVLTVRLPEEVFELTVEKGSITIDGVSLTVAGLLPGGLIEVALVPFTLSHTIADSYRPGTKVNVEADIIGKYVFAYMERKTGGVSRNNP